MPFSIKKKTNNISHNIIYEKFHKKDRILLFSDAVFAIVLTLLILELKTTSKTEKWNDFSEISDTILAYILSYLFIINLWFGHNQLFRVVDKIDNRIIWLNNFLLLNISFTPYPITIISAHPESAIGVVLFGITAILNPLLYMGIFTYALHNKLLHLNIDLKKALKLRKQFLLLCPLSVIPIILAFINTTISVLLYIAISISGVILGSKVNLIQLGTHESKSET